MNNYHQVDIQLLYNITGNEEEFVIELINTFLAIAPNKIQKLIAALLINDRQQILFMSHKLKGTFRYVAATNMGDLFEEIENKCHQGIEIDDRDNLINKINLLFEHTKTDLQSILLDITSK